VIFNDHGKKFGDNMKNSILTFFLILPLWSLGTFQSAQADGLELVTLQTLTQEVQWMGDANTSKAHSTLVFKVSSGGCTKASDFQILKMDTPQTQRIKLVRNNPDRCKMISSPIEITIQTDALKVANIFSVIIENPILPDGLHTQVGELFPLR
jgi:hypothetical protein